MTPAAKNRRIGTAEMWTRLHEDEAALAREIAHRRGENTSHLLRRSLLKEIARLGFLEERDLLALDVKEEENG